MKKSLIALAAVTLLAVALLAVPVFAADLTGTWSTAVATDAGSGTVTFVLKQDGEKLTGSYSSEYGDATVSGTITGSDVTIEFETSGIKAVYKGKIDSAGTKIEGTCDYGGQASGTFTATKQ
jgi:hypothetical protein